MRTLSATKCAAMRAFILREARPLERALLGCYLDGAPADAALAELGRFQNPDGGFGRALEPDLRLPDSSALATTVGLQVLRALGVASEHSLVRGAIGHLTSTVDDAALAWPSAPLAANAHPHAPWWGRDPEGPLVGEGELDSPRPEVLGYLYERAALVEPGFLARVSESTMARFRRASDEMEMHAFGCYQRLAEAPGLPPELRDELTGRLTSLLGRVVERDPAKWSGYCLRPLDVAASPDGIFAGALREDAERQLDWELERLGDDGTVRPPWDWGGLYPDVWPEAAREWSGWLTLDLLRKLYAYGRVG